jgi:hypothetical protein
MASIILSTLNFVPFYTLSLRRMNTSFLLICDPRQSLSLREAAKMCMNLNMVLLAIADLQTLPNYRSLVQSI